MTLEQLIHTVQNGIRDIQNHSGTSIEDRIEAIAKVQETIDAATFALDEPDDAVDDPQRDADEASIEAFGDDEPERGRHQDELDEDSNPARDPDAVDGADDL